MPSGIYTRSPEHREKMIKNLIPGQLGNHWGIKDTAKMKGRHPKTEFKKGDMLGSKNVNYKETGYSMVALHEWIKRRLAKPLGCNHCGEIKLLDLANKSHEYKRELDDWLWLCRKCHAKYDNNYPYLHERRITI